MSAGPVFSATTGWRPATAEELRSLYSAMGEPPSSVEYLLRTPEPSAVTALPADAPAVAVDGSGFYSSDDEGPATPAPVAQHTGD